MDTCGNTTIVFCIVPISIYGCIFRCQIYCRTDGNRGTDRDYVVCDDTYYALCIYCGIWTVFFVDLRVHLEAFLTGCVQFMSGLVKN